MSKTWVAVKLAGSVEQANLVAGFLRSHGIAAEPDSHHVHPELSLGGAGGIQIMVPPEDRTVALRLLAESEEDGTIPAMDGSSVEADCEERSKADLFDRPRSIEPR